MCSESKIHLNNIMERALLKLPDTSVSKVHFIEINEVSKYFMQFETPLNKQGEKVIKGYRVKVKYKSK